MGKAHFGGLQMDVLSKNASKEDVKKFLINLTDEDFNGNNGEDYFTEAIIDGKTQLISRLDNCMLDINNYNNLEDFIAYVLKCNYEDGYYTEYSYEIKTLDDNIVVALATQYI